MKILTIFLILATIVSCSSISKDPLIDRAESNASLGGRRILEASRAMIANREIIVGGCWDYINTVYQRAGYSANQRDTIFKSKLQGPYLQTERILPGDWLYFVNHSYGDTEHSAILWPGLMKKKRVL